MLNIIVIKGTVVDVPLHFARLIEFVSTSPVEVTTPPPPAPGSNDSLTWPGLVYGIYTVCT